MTFDKGPERFKLFEWNHLHSMARPIWIKVKYYASIKEAKNLHQLKSPSMTQFSKNSGTICTFMICTNLPDYVVVWSEWRDFKWCNSGPLAAVVVFVTFTQIGSGHTVFHIVFSEQRHLIRFHFSMNIHPIVSVE